MKQRTGRCAAALLCAAMLLGQMPAQAADAGVHVTAEKGADSQIILTVAAENLTYNAFQFTLSYDKERLEPSDMETNAATQDVNKLTAWEIPVYNAWEQTGWATVRPRLGAAEGLLEYVISVAPDATDAAVKDGFVSATSEQKLLRMSFRAKAGQTLYADSIKLGHTDGNPTGIAIAAKNEAYTGAAGEDPVRPIEQASIVSFDLSRVAQAANTPGASGDNNHGDTGKPGDKPVTVEPDAPAIVTLRDISGHWAETSIRKLVSAGIVQGKPGDMFEPEASLTRAEFAVIANRRYKLPAAQGDFTDTVNHWAAKEIAAAKQAGLLSGEGNGSFVPDRAISRQELAVILTRAEKAAGGKQEPKFADDASIADWAKDGVYTLRSAGFVRGYADGGFHPAQAVTRGEMASIVAQLAD